MQAHFCLETLVVFHVEQCILTISVKGMDLYLSIEPFQGGCLCAVDVVPLLRLFFWSCYLWYYDVALDGYLDAVAFGIQNHAFVIPVAGGSGLPYNGDSVSRHFFGELVHFFFRSNRKGDMGKTEMFHVEHLVILSYVGTVHYFQSGAVFESDESAGELFCRVVIKRLNNPTEILPVEFADNVNVFDPDGNVLDFHDPLFKIS